LEDEVEVINRSGKRVKKESEGSLSGKKEYESAYGRRNSPSSSSSHET